MPVSVPTPDQLKYIAAEMGLSLTDADIDSFIDAHEAEHRGLQRRRQPARTTSRR